MADNYLITGYWGEPHVTVENDRSFNAAVFGAGKFVLPVGEMFRAEYIGNNTVRIHDGKLIDNGAVAGIPTGSYIDLLIPEAGQGMKRNDLIIFEYSKDASTLVESGVFKVLSGTETSGTAADPALTENNLLTGNAYSDQMALWRIPVSGAVISAPEILYNTKFAGERIANAHSEDGKVYTANLPGVAKLYTGLEITIIPDTASTTTLPSLNVNGVGDVYIKRRITSNTKTTVQSEGEEFLQKDQPIRVIYNGSAWVADMARANANDIYGTVPVEKGGTGATTAAKACANLGAIPTSQKGAANGVATLDSNGRIPGSQLPDGALATRSSEIIAYKTGKVIHFFGQVTPETKNSNGTKNYALLATADYEFLLDRYPVNVHDPNGIVKEAHIINNGASYAICVAFNSFSVTADVYITATVIIA